MKYVVALKKRERYTLFYIMSIMLRNLHKLAFCLLEHRV
jgi:hypothetical protein